MKKVLLVIILISSYIPAKSQNVRLLKSFDRIMVREQRYNVEGQIASILDFSLKDDKYGAHDAKNFSHLTYEDKNGNEIYLDFYKGKLFDKRLMLYHPVQERTQAKEEYENVKKYVVGNNKISKKEHQVETTGSYGETGEGEIYILSPKNKFFSVALSGVLDISYPAGNIKQFISGYNVTYEYSDFFDVGARIYN